MKIDPQEVAEKVIASARIVAEGHPTLGELIKQGRDPMIAKTYYEFGAILRTVAEELGYNHFHLDGDHGIDVINVKDLLAVATKIETYASHQSFKEVLDNNYCGLL